MFDASRCRRDCLCRVRRVHSALQRACSVAEAQAISVKLCNTAATLSAPRRSIFNVRPPKHEILMQVALMFLVKDKIPTEPIWSAFMVSAAELRLRRAIPPSRPAPPALFPDLPPNDGELASKCWRHGGMVVPLVVPPRPKFKGASCAVVVELVAKLDVCASSFGYCCGRGCG